MRLNMHRDQATSSLVPLIFDQRNNNLLSVRFTKPFEHQPIFPSPFINHHTTRILFRSPDPC